MGQPSAKIGRIWLQGPDGKVQTTALYDLPSVLREAVLHINGGAYRQVGQTSSGTWIYRFTGPLGAQQPSEPDVKDFRNSDSPLWDGPPPVVPPATMGDVKKHFAALLENGLSSDDFADVYRHALAVRDKKVFTPKPLTKVGRIWLTAADGNIFGTALYDSETRNAVLNIDGGIYQQSGQSPSGTFIYRYQGPCGTRPNDPDVKDFRNTDSPLWDGPATPIATMDDVKQHFEALLEDGLTGQEFDYLYRHFIAARNHHPFKLT